MDRFSLLLLEPGEIYFEDFKVVHHVRPEDKVPAVHNEVPGRLKVCSKSLVFVPANTALPMLKFCLADCTAVQEWTPRSFQSALAAKRELMVVTVSQTIEMLRHNLIAPFKFVRSHTSHVFSFTYRKAAECLGQVQQLRRAASLPPVEQAGMVAAINYSIQSRLSFDTCWLENIGERIVVETVGNRITPLVLNPGRVLLTNERLYFQPYNNVEVEPVTRIKLSSVTALFRRRYLLRPQGLELQYRQGGGHNHIYLSFSKPGDRDLVYKAMLEQENLTLAKEEEENVTLKWQHGVISNYDYLLHLNSQADRSFNDLTQYPVFPWVVADYSSNSLDLDSETTFRDLSKPMGALTPSRLASLKTRREEMGQVPSYLYGSHYSCPGFILYYLVRRVPQFMLCLQNGRFDHPDRMFNSIPQTWRNVTTNQSDFKELVPEFYDTEQGGDFLVNSLGIDFGVRHTGDTVGDVTLPSWATDKTDFVAKLRWALESPAVSRQLHLWIDLIFGYKSSGEEAEKADNVFYPLCYEGNVDLDKISDLNERYALEVQISEFGQVPKQIFHRAHPARYTTLPAVVHARAPPASDSELGRCRWPRIGRLVRLGDHQAHKEAVSALALVGDDLIASASHDSNVRLYRFSTAAVERSFSARSITISSIVSPTKDTLVFSCWDNSIMVYGVLSGTWRSNTPAHNDAVSCLVWARGLLASGSWDGTVKIWKCEAANDNFAVRLSDLVSQLEHGSPVTCLAIRIGEDGGSLAAGTREGEVLVWSGEGSAWALAHRLPSHTRQVNCLALSPSHDRIISGGSDFGLKVMDLRTGAVVFSKKVGEEVTCIAWDGVAALVAGGRGELSYWDLSKGNGPGLVVGGHTGRVTAMAVGSSGGTLVTAGEDKRVIMWWMEED